MNGSPGIDAAARALFEARYSGHANGLWPTLEQRMKDYWRAEATPIVEAVLADLNAA